MTVKSIRTLLMWITCALTLGLCVLWFSWKLALILFFFGWTQNLENMLTGRMLDK